MASNDISFTYGNLAINIDIEYAINCLSSTISALASGIFLWHRTWRTDRSKCDLSFLFTASLQTSKRGGLLETDNQFNNTSEQEYEISGESVWRSWNHSITSQRPLHSHIDILLWREVLHAAFFLTGNSAICSASVFDIVCRFCEHSFSNLIVPVGRPAFQDGDKYCYDQCITSNLVEKILVDHCIELDS